MKKVKLNLDQLKVNSFETAEAVFYKGTVKGNYDSEEVCSLTRYCPPTTKADVVCCDVSLIFQECDTIEICI